MFNYTIYSKVHYYCDIFRTVWPCFRNCVDRVSAAFSLVICLFREKFRENFQWIAAFRRSSSASQVSSPSNDAEGKSAKLTGSPLGRTRAGTTLFRSRNLGRFSDVKAITVELQEIDEVYSHNWLVVEPYPSEKIYESVGMMTLPTYGQS